MGRVPPRAGGTIAHAICEFPVSAELLRAGKGSKQGTDNRRQPRQETFRNSLLITAPILAGKLDCWNRFISSTLNDRRQDYETSIVEGGV